MGRIIIPAIDPRCPAALALEREGVEHELVLMEDDYSYSNLLSRCWTQEFVVLEHDVVPFIGAVDELLNCREEWCGYHYPFAKNAIRGALGCVKFGEHLVKNTPHLPMVWENTLWWQLDGKVFPAVISASGMKWFHRHTPDLAHVKG